MTYVKGAWFILPLQPVTRGQTLGQKPITRRPAVPLQRDFFFWHHQEENIFILVEVMMWRLRRAAEGILLYRQAALNCFNLDFTNQSCCNELIEDI